MRFRRHRRQPCPRNDGFLPAGHAGRTPVVSYARAVANCAAEPIHWAAISCKATALGAAASAVINPLSRYLGIEKDDAGGLLSGNLDGVQVIDRERIFAHGFEVTDPS
jgi:hypothetical protein